MVKVQVESDRLSLRRYRTECQRNFGSVRRLTKQPSSLAYRAVHLFNDSIA